MNKRNLRLISVMSVLLASAPAFGQVLNGGATGSIGGGVSGTLQRPTAIDQMHSERDRIEQAGASSASKVRQSAEVASERTRDRAVDTKDKVVNRASSIAGDASVAASGALSATQATAASSAQSAAHAAGTAAVTANALISADQSVQRDDTPVETHATPQLDGEPTGEAVDASTAGAANVLGGAYAQTQSSDERSVGSPSSVSLDGDLSGNGDADVAAKSARADSNAQANAGASRDGMTLRSDASASGETNARVNHTN